MQEQLRLFDKHKKQATLALSAYLHRHSARLTLLARERLQTLGVDEYGDASWHLSREKKKESIDEELADAINNEIFFRAHEAGDLK